MKQSFSLFTIILSLIILLFLAVNVADGNGGANEKARKPKKEGLTANTNTKAQAANKGNDKKAGAKKSTAIEGQDLSPLEAAIAEGGKEAVQQALATLTPREAEVLRMRFGIEKNTNHTLEEVEKRFEVTRERIRQIEAKALRKLRHPTRATRLQNFLDHE